MDILITENIWGGALQNLTEFYTVEKRTGLWRDKELLGKLIANAKALIIRNQTEIDREIIDKAVSLRVIGRTGAGYDNIDVEYASEKGIVVCYTPDANTIATAELSLGLMVALARKIPSGDRTVKQQKWDRQGHIGIELKDKKLGIVGFGKIGKAVALRAESFGMDISFYDKYMNSNSINQNYNSKSFEDVLRESDIITVHLPLTDETKKIFNNKAFNLMKEESFLINTSRGGVIDENDLILELKNGKFRGVALDVRETEPPVKSELENFNNVILTPHIGGFTEESQERAVTSIAKDIHAVLNNKQAVNFINFARPQLQNSDNN